MSLITDNSPSLTLTLQESQDVLLADGALHVTDDRPAGVVHELNTDLRDTTTGASAPKDLRFVRKLKSGNCPWKVNKEL